MEKSRTIIIFSSHRTLESGGVGTHIKHLIAEMNKSGYPHHVILGTGRKRLYERAFRNLVDTVFHPAREKNVHYFMNMVFVLAEELDETLQRITEQAPDTEFVIHCHERQTVFAASLLSDRYNIRIVQTLHAPFAEQYGMSHPEDHHIQNFTRIIEPGLSLTPGHLIAVDALQKQIVEDKHGSPSLHITEIINSVDIDIEVAEESYIETNYGVRDYIVVARHLHKKNGVENAVKAFSLIKDKSYKLYVIGDGPEKESLQKLITESGLNERVFLIGRQPHDTSLNIIAHAKLSLVPSVPIGIYIEAASLTMLESMLLGTPVVASNIGGLKEVLDNRKTGMLVKDGDPGELAAAIDELLEDDSLYRSVAAQAKELIVKSYNSAAWFQKISAVYDNV